MKPLGVLIVSTGTLANSLKALAEKLLDKRPYVKSLALRREDRWGEAAAKMKKAMARANKGRGVLVLADLAGGTPFNVASALRKDLAVEVLGGVNVPMVLKAIQIATEMELAKAATYLERYGQDHVVRGVRDG
jgi:mannose PTS system EIIA component